jgi:hypothetical protein
MEIERQLKRMKILKRQMYGGANGAAFAFYLGRHSEIQNAALRVPVRAIQKHSAFSSYFFISTRMPWIVFSEA